MKQIHYRAIPLDFSISEEFAETETESLAERLAELFNVQAKAGYMHDKTFVVHSDFGAVTSRRILIFQKITSDSEGVPA